MDDLNSVGIFFDIVVCESEYCSALRTLTDTEFRIIEDDLVDIVKIKAGAVSLKEVVIGILKKDNCVLMVNRRIAEGTATALLTWQFPAGIVKSGVSEEDTIVKEIFEETGVICKPLRRLGRRKHPVTNVICNYWIVEYISGEISNGDPHENQEVDWVSLYDYHGKVSSSLFHPIKTYLDEEE